MLVDSAGRPVVLLAAADHLNGDTRMDESLLHTRLRAAVGSRSYREIGDLTGTNSETVRRYMLGQSPSVEFLTGLCGALSLNAEWVLTGRGPMHRGEVRGHALREANPHELLTAVAETLERLLERVERVEVFLQTLEVRLRANPPAGVPAGHAGATKAAVPLSERARGVADALPG
jgi:transcriptional regulator with XRE-family HTH domain